MVWLFPVQGLGAMQVTTMEVVEMPVNHFIRQLRQSRMDRCKTAGLKDAENPFQYALLVTPCETLLSLCPVQVLAPSYRRVKLHYRYRLRQRWRIRVEADTNLFIAVNVVDRQEPRRFANRLLQMEGKHSDKRRRIMSRLFDDTRDNNRSFGEPLERPCRARVRPAQTRKAEAETNAQNEGKATHDVESIIAAESCGWLRL
jgi:hypothetical protein